MTLLNGLGSAMGRAFLLLGVVGLLQACSTPERLVAVPTDRATEAIIPGIPDARLFVESDPSNFAKAGMESIHRELAYLESQGHTGDLPPANFLVISGGGDNGAFGAGLLNGWTKAGNRPEFKLVTGISTGALIAPFAFLGSEYDDVLKEVYTSISSEDIYEERGLLEGFLSDGLSDTTPLFGLVAKYADQDLLDAIAREYERGRILLVATSDMDDLRPVIWNIGAIAASDDPKALPLFHKILVASASIPGAFPPVMFDVELDGMPYQEMHVDGGAMAQAFLYPPSLNVEELAKKEGIQRERYAYIIRNAKLKTEWASVERQTLDIIGRAIASLIQTQGIGDLYRMYLQTEKDHVDFNLAYVPPSFDAPHPAEFDNVYMRQLYQFAFDLAEQGYPWEKYPPGYSPGN